MARVNLASKGDYEIVHIDDEVVFLNRRTQPSSITTVLTLTLAALTGFGAILWFYFGVTGKWSAAGSYMA
ncbi:hypothetical protein KDL45_09750, partial [bacterium]|nr:hypothetical protein [bacterium]